MVKLFAGFKKIKPWYFLILTVILASICFMALRANNDHMNQLRQTVYAADKNGTNVEAALANLEKYVTSNMNTNLSSGPNSVYPPIQLTYSYNRAVGSQTAALQQQNTSLYTAAEDYCQSEVPQGFSGRYRVPCIEQYVTSHGLAQASVPSSLYEFDFISPTWSPDLAGWMMVLAAVSAVITIVSFIIYWQSKRNAKTSS